MNHSTSIINLLSNCTSIRTNIRDYWQYAEDAYLILTIVCGCVTLGICVMYTEMAHYTQVNLKSSKWKTHLHMITAIFMLYSIAGLMTLIAPRTADLNHLAAVGYLCLCLILFTRMLFSLLGGKKKMFERLGSSTIPVGSPPCCCLGICVKACGGQPAVTMRRINLVNILIWQASLVKPFCTYMLTFLFIDYIPIGLYGLEKPSTIHTRFFTVFNAINTLSMLLMLYGTKVFTNMVANIIPKVTIVRSKFAVLQICYILDNTQALILGILVNAGVIQCDKYRSAATKRDRILSILIIFEMLIISIISRVRLKKEINQLNADKFENELDRGLDNNHTGGAINSNAEKINHGYSNNMDDDADDVRNVAEDVINASASINLAEPSIYI